MDSEIAFVFSRLDRSYFGHEKRAGSLLPSFDLYVFDTVAQNDIDQLIAGVICLACDLVQFGERVLSDAHRYDAVSVLSAFFDLQWFVFHETHLVNPDIIID